MDLEPDRFQVVLDYRGLIEARLDDVRLLDHATYESITDALPVYQPVEARIWIAIVPPAPPVSPSVSQLPGSPD